MQSITTCQKKLLLEAMKLLIDC